MLRGAEKYLITFGIGVLISFSSVLAPLSTAQAKHKITFEDLQSIKTIIYGELSVSPDGHWLAYISSGTLWIASVADSVGARSLGVAQRPTWAPDSKRLAYYANDTHHHAQLFVFDVETGHSKMVTSFDLGVKPDPTTAFIGAFGYHNDALTYSWSPDSNSIVFSSQVRVGTSSVPSTVDLSPGQPLVLTRNTPPSWTLAHVFSDSPGTWPYNIFNKHSHDVEPHIDQLFITDIPSNRVRQLTTGNLGYFTPAWSPDGNYIVCISAEGRVLAGWGSGPTNLYEIDPKTGDAHALTSDSLYKTVPQISPDGRFIAFHSQDTPGNSSLSEIPAAGGRVVNLTDKLDRQPEEFRWDAQSKEIVFLFQDGRSYKLAQVDLATTKIKPVLPQPEDPAYRTNLSVSQSNVVFWVQSDGSSPMRIYSLPIGSSDLAALPLDLNPQIKNWTLGEQRVVHWRNSHGDDLDGILITPPGYEKGRRYPMIVDGYPQVVNGFQREPMSGNQAWASEGYVVFYPASRAPHVALNPYTSTQFSLSGKGIKGIELMVDDVNSGVTKLVNDGIVDENRIGLYGYSNGGGVATQLIAATDRFKCAVIVAPAVSVDWTLPFLLFTYQRLIPDIVGGTPWEAPEQYTQLSIAYKMNRITTPTLLADGDADTGFLLGTIELYNGLRWLGRDTTLLRYPNQGHEFEGPAAKDLAQRTLQFFGEHLN